MEILVPFICDTRRERQLNTTLVFIATEAFFLWSRQIYQSSVVAATLRHRQEASSYTEAVKRFPRTLPFVFSFTLPFPIRPEHHCCAVPAPLAQQPPLPGGGRACRGLGAVLRPALPARLRRPVPPGAVGVRLPSSFLPQVPPAFIFPGEL